MTTRYRAEKSTSDEIDMTFEFERLFESGESIVTADVTCTLSVVVSDVTFSGTSVTFWLSGGTAGTATISCTITTNQDRTYVRTVSLHVAARIPLAQLPL